MTLGNSNVYLLTDNQILSKNNKKLLGSEDRQSLDIFTANIRLCFRNDPEKTWINGKKYSLYDHISKNQMFEINFLETVLWNDHFTIVYQN